MEEKNTVLEDAEKIKGLLRHPGWEVYEKRLKEIRNLADDRLKDEHLDDEKVPLKARQVIFNTLNKVILEIPQEFLEAAENYEIETEEQGLEERVIKENIPFIGRK